MPLPPSSRSLQGVRCIPCLVSELGSLGAEIRGKCLVFPTSRKVSRRLIGSQFLNSQPLPCVGSSDIPLTLRTVNREDDERTDIRRRPFVVNGIGSSRLLVGFEIREAIGAARHVFCRSSGVVLRYRSLNPSITALVVWRWFRAWMRGVRIGAQKAPLRRHSLRPRFACMWAPGERKIFEAKFAICPIHLMRPPESLMLPRMRQMWRYPS